MTVILIPLNLGIFIPHINANIVTLEMWADTSKTQNYSTVLQNMVYDCFVAFVTMVCLSLFIWKILNFVMRLQTVQIT